MTPVGGLLLIQGGCFSQQVRIFLHPAEDERAEAQPNDAQDAIPFYVLPGAAVQDAVSKVCAIGAIQRPAALAWECGHPRSPLQFQPCAQGGIGCPSLWVDAAEAAAGIASLSLVYCLGGAPQLCRLPVKPIKLQPVRKAVPPAPGPSGPAAFKAFLPAKAHLQLYRLVHSLAPTLQRWHEDLRRSGVHVVDPHRPGMATFGADQVRAMPVDKVSRAACWLRRCGDRRRSPGVAPPHPQQRASPPTVPVARRACFWSGTTRRAG